MEEKRMLEWLSILNKKEKTLWALFCFTCFQLVTKLPNITLIPGERTKVFSGLLCGITLVVLLATQRKTLRLTREWIICIVLSLIIILSGFVSSDSPSSFWRGFTLIFSGIGGFWCGRLLLNTAFHRLLFARLCLVLLTLLLLLGIAGYFSHANVLHFADIHKHTLNNLILLLSFGPLSLLYKSNRWVVITGVLYLLAGYYVISLSFDPLVWFPPVLLLGALLLRKKKKNYTFLVPLLLVFLLAASFHIYKLPKHFFDKENISVWVRVENVFFSYHMAKKKPLLGIGLVAPRLEYLDDYTIIYPYVTKEQFSEVLPDVNRSSENQILTFMCDLGFPFLLLYSFSVLVLYKNLLRNMLQRRCVGEVNPILLWVPITGALLHYQFFDGLLSPQTTWFFHIFLGMISVQRPESAEPAFQFGEKQADTSRVHHLVAGKRGLL